VIVLDHKKKKDNGFYREEWLFCGLINMEGHFCNR
jgi:hypothetical protein